MNSKGHTTTNSCAFFKKSRQGYYNRIKCDSRKQLFNRRVIAKVKQIRQLLPKCGTRKLWYMLNQEGISIGRDRLFNILREEKLLIKRNRKAVKTTDSKHSLFHYDNLVKDLVLKEAEQVFVSDITYIRTTEGFCYLAIVADAYTKKIMGKFFHKDMHTTLVLKAVAESLNNKQYSRTGRLIHHSDHGSQYSSRTYRNALKLNDILISMAGIGKAWENPVAERIIGILKDEFGLDQLFKNYEEAYGYIEDAIDKYNRIRPHLSCGYLTPEQAHEQGCNLKQVWKQKFSTFPQKEERKKEAKKERRKTTTTTTM